MTQHKTVEYLYFSNLQINLKCFGRINFTCINLQNIQAASLSTYKKQNSLQFQSRELNFIINFIMKKIQILPVGAQNLCKKKKHKTKTSL